MPLLPRFLAENPELEIDVILDDRVIDLVAEGIDFSLRMGTLADSTAVARKLATCGRSVLATPGYLARAGEPKTPADLAAHEAVVYSQTASVWSVSQNGTETSVAVHGRVRVSAAEGIREAVLADLWAVFPTGRMMSAKARQFAAFVEQAFAGHSAAA